MTTDVRDPRSLPEDGFHEIQLSGKQLVFLFMATTVVSVVIFLCGVLVGRGVRPGADAARAALSPTTDVAAAEPAAAPGAATAAAPETAAPATDAPVAGGERALVAAEPPKESLDAPEEAPSTPESAAPASSPAAAAAAPGVKPASAPASADAWIVQVTALKKRGEAQAIAKRLVRRGYNAFVLDPQPGSTPFYRVRVGPFTDKAEAEKTVKRLTSEEQFKPWISR